MATNTLQERNWQAIEKVLPSGWQELARSLGVIKKVPEQLGAKIKEIGPLLRLVLFHVSMHESLRIATARAAAAKVIDISPVALHLRMRKLGAYLRELLRRMVEDHGLFSPPRWAGYELIMVDGTSLTTDGAQGTSARVHYAIRLEDVNVVQMEVTDETGGETFKRFAAKPGQLWVADRGYSNPPGIHSIVAQGADVLVRVNRGALPVYTPAGTKDRPGKRIDLLALVRTHKKRGHPYEIQAWVHPEKEKPIPGRLLMLHLPKEQAQEARARARGMSHSLLKL